MAEGAVQDDATRLDSRGSSSDAAAEPLDDQNDLFAGLTGLTVSVRFTDGSTTDLEDLYIGSQESVLDVKGRIRVLRPGLSTNRLRLIYLGRVMSDSTRPSQWITNLVRRQRQRENPSSIASSIRRSIAGIDISALEGVVKGAVFSSDSSHADGRQEEPGTSRPAPSASRDMKGKGRGIDASAQGNDAGAARKIWLHCSVGEAGSIEKEEPAQDTARLSTPSSLPEAPESTAPQPLRGFDRLREAGFSPDDIANLRVQFHEDGPGDTAILGDEDPEAQALEDRWMEGLGARGEDAGSPSADIYSTLLRFVIAGFFLPFLPLFFFRAESNIFSRKAQMAIVAGVSINVVYGALRIFA